MDIQELKEKRDEILAIAAKHGASHVQIFGSVARGEAREDSDIDFLVKLEPDRTLLDQIALIQDLEDLLSSKVDVVEPQMLHELIQQKVFQEAIDL